MLSGFVSQGSGLAFASQVIILGLSNLVNIASRISYPWYLQNDCMWFALSQISVSQPISDEERFACNVARNESRRKRTKLIVQRHELLLIVDCDEMKS